MTRSTSWHRCLLPLAAAGLIVALAALAPTPAAADEPPTPSDQPAATTPADDGAEAAAGESQAVDFSGMLVHIDPKTGRLRPPTPAEAEALSRALAQRLRQIESTSAAARSEQHLANGAVMVELDPAYHDYTVVRRTPQGDFVHDCVHGPDRAVEVAKTPAEAPAAPEEK